MLRTPTYMFSFIISRKIRYQRFSLYMLYCGGTGTYDVKYRSSNIKQSYKFLYLRVM